MIKIKISSLLNLKVQITLLLAIINSQLHCMGKEFFFYFFSLLNKIQQK
jgi:hypothetical protein